MRSSVRDGWLIALFLALVVLSNIRFLYQGDWDMNVRLTGATTGMLLMCVVMLGTQIIKRRNGPDGTRASELGDAAN